MQPTTDYFELFSLPRSFALDEDALEIAYFRLQRAHHPDRVATASGIARQQAMQISVLLNDAYQTLRNPLKRARYLLSLNGIRVGGEQDSVKPSPAILAESIEWREAAMEAKTPEALAALADKAAAERAGCLKMINASAQANDWNAAANQAIRLGYLEKTMEELRTMRSTRPL